MGPYSVFVSTLVGNLIRSRVAMIYSNQKSVFSIKDYIFHKSLWFMLYISLCCLFLLKTTAILKTKSFLNLSHAKQILILFGDLSHFIICFTFPVNSYFTESEVRTILYSLKRFAYGQWHNSRDSKTLKLLHTHTHLLSEKGKEMEERKKVAKTNKQIVLCAVSLPWCLPTVMVVGMKPWADHLLPWGTYTYQQEARLKTGVGLEPKVLWHEIWVSQMVT